MPCCSRTAEIIISTCILISIFINISIIAWPFRWPCSRRSARMELEEGQAVAAVRTPVLDISNINNINITRRTIIMILNAMLPPYYQGYYPYMYSYMYMCLHNIHIYKYIHGLVRGSHRAARTPRRRPASSSPVCESIYNHGYSLIRITILPGRLHMHSMYFTHLYVYIRMYLYNMGL